MSGPSPRRLRLLLAGLIAGLGVLVTSIPASANGLSLIFPDPVSPNGHRIYDLYVYISYPAIAIFLGVEVGLLYIILKFRRRHAEHVGKDIHGNTRLEIVWTVIPTIIVAVIAVLSFVELQRDFSAEAANANADMTVAVRGYQFNWTYKYQEPNRTAFTVGDTMVVPVDKMVHMTFDSDNVIHSWWVPALTGKTDSVPGYTNQSWIKIDKDALSDCRGGGARDTATGGCKWHGECAELCGAGHSSMQIDVLGVSQEQYDRWAAAQRAKPQDGKKPPPSPTPTPTPSY